MPQVRADGALCIRHFLYILEKPGAALRIDGGFLLLGSLLLAARLGFPEVALQRVEAAFPEALVREQPVCRILQGPRLEPARAPLRLAPASDEARTLQHLQVLRDRRQA